MSKPILVLCAGLFLVIYITDQLSSVTGHSLKSPAARREKNGGKRTESLMEEIMNELRDGRRQQKRSTSHVRSTTHQTISAGLLQSIAPYASRPVIGLATRADKVYIAYDNYNNRPATVEIYDVPTFRLQRRLNVDGLECIQDIASCPGCDVVFIADYCYPYEIHVIQYGDVGQLGTQWNVDSQPVSLSVNSQSNVIVTFGEHIREYTPSGELVRETTLPSDIQPWHAIQLDDDRYAVSHSSAGLRQVCIVAGNGTVIQCYGGQSGSGVGQLSYPRHLALFGESLLVADYFNNRVLQLNVSSLTYIGELINTSSEGRKPLRLEVNEDEARLYVAYADGPDVRVYNLITE